MRRGRRRTRKLKMNPKSLKSVFAVFVLLVGLLSLISVFIESGSLLSVVHKKQIEFFGYGSIIFPFLLILLSLLMFESIRFKFVNFRVFFGLSLLFVNFVGLLAATVSESSGGLAGVEISDTLISVLTIFGAVLTLLFGLVASFILVFDVSLDQVFSFVKEAKGKVASGLSKMKPELPVINTNALDQGGEEEEPSLTGRAGEPSFEIVQSALEPVDTKNVRTSKQPQPGKESHPTSLPYTDRVWEYPPLDLLADFGGSAADRGDVKQRQQIIEKTLASFGIKARVAETNFGPAVTQYALEFTSVNKIAKVTNLQNDLALALASPTGSVRIEAPIPGKSLIGIEVPNISTALVSFKSMVTSDIMKSAKSKLTISLGYNVSGLPCIADISKMPHLLIAGSTGSGKSVFLHSVLFSLLYRCSPAECKFILVDPKRVELFNYNDIPHLMVPVITDPERAPVAFRWAVSEMERRYKLFENTKVRNINAYNELSGFQALPFIVIIVDELAELMALQPVEMERSIVRLSQLSRATGIHLVLATQSPRVDIITGLIKANIPARTAFSVSSQIESRIIIDTIGAEKLLGRGDMLYVPPETSKPVRIQGVFVSDKEISNLVSFLKGSGVTPDYKEEIVEVREVKTGLMESSDELFEEAVKVVMASDKASSSLLQRKLSIGYARAARLLDELESKGIVGPADGSKPRDILIRNPEHFSSPAQFDE